MTVRRKRQKNQKVQVTNLDTLEQINRHAAGLDIGAAEIWACVPANRAEQSVRCFETFTADLHALADWLEAWGIETVAMESTGVYWIPIYEILEAKGLKVNLINAQHIKNVPGKKTDVLDCQSPKGRRSALDPEIAQLWLVASLLSSRGTDGCA